MGRTSNARRSVQVARFSVGRPGYGELHSQAWKEATVKAVHCPCGEVIEAETDDELVEKTQQHVREDHPELESEYTREKILSIAHDH